MSRDQKTSCHKYRAIFSCDDHLASMIRTFGHLLCYDGMIFSYILCVVYRVVAFPFVWSEPLQILHAEHAKEYTEDNLRDAIQNIVFQFHHQKFDLQ